MPLLGVKVARRVLFSTSQASIRAENIGGERLYRVESKKMANQNAISKGILR
jgi:hypothetical protein